MQTLSLLSGSELLKRTQDLVSDEGRATMDLIEHLREIERRMLFLETGHSSLFEFAVKHLGLSEGSAQRRISAMRLIRDIPEAKAKLESGEISLSNASQVQSVFRAARAAEQSDKNAVQKMSVPMSIEDKKEVLEKISGMTQRECQSALLKFVPQAASQLMERERQVSEDRFELKLVISKELHEEISKLKALLSHSLPLGSASELIEYLVKQEVKRQEKKRGISSASPSEAPELPELKEEERTNRDGKASAFTAAPVRNEIKRSRKAISRPVQREIWRLAKGHCQYPGCGSRYRLEIDHIVPYAKGGADTVDNLRLYCRSHNQGHAMESFGVEKMNSYRRV
jgi:5-methylcytosine-specific restriction endonuclease McrA